MWFSLAAHADEDALKQRDALSKKMTPQQIAKAKDMAKEWMEKKQEN